MEAETRLEDLLAAIAPKYRKAWRRHIESLAAGVQRDLAPVADLSEATWQRLKQNILGQVDQRQPARGWPQARDLLHEARAFQYLQRQGCEEIAFSAPTMLAKSPDLIARQGFRRILCEVKTIRLTADDALPAAFARKLLTRLRDAEKQLRADDDTSAQRLVYVILDRDGADGRPELVAEITAILRRSMPAGLDFVLDTGACAQ
ncbi:hypothetical protein [Dongia sp.]|uniref:hypothetical protein n=1 Tax=Dongia sp. TaxID=1977262 RepID=UPI0035B0732F